MSRHPRLIRTWLIAALLLIIPPRVSFAEKPQAWSRLRSPNFIVVTNGSEKQARRVAYQFEMIRAVLRQYLNIKGSATDPPVIVIATKDETTFKPLLPEIYLAKGSTHLAGYYMGGPEKNYVALRLDAGQDLESYERYETVYHEYVHYLTRRWISLLPLWLTEGLAEFYGNTRIENKFVAVGAPSDSNLQVLHQSPMLPLATLFAVNASSPYYHEENKTSIFYAESWVLTHYLMVQDWHDKADHLRQFVALLAQDASPEDAARRTIGDPHALEVALRAYIDRASFIAARLPAPPEVDEKTFVPEPISDAESLALRADLMVHNRRYAAARQMLEEAMKADPKLAAAYESMGLLYAGQNQTEEANKWYSQAVALNSQSYLAHFYYATNIFKGRLDDDGAAKAEASLRAAIKINAQFAPAYDALAFLLATRHRDLEDARMMALQAVTLEPGNIHYRLRMVQVLVELARPDDALRVATRAASMAKTPQEFVEAQAALNSARQFQEYARRSREREEGLRTTPEAANDPEHLAPREAPAPGEKPAPDETKPPVLRHRGEATTIGPGDSGSGAQVPRPRPELLPGQVVADGAITDATCPDSVTLELTVVTHTGIKQLYGENYYKIPFSALNFTPQGVLNPCSDIKGMHARITYHPAKNDVEQGEIVEVQLSK